MKNAEKEKLGGRVIVKLVVYQTDLQDFAAIQMVLENAQGIYLKMRKFQILDIQYRRMIGKTKLGLNFKKNFSS